MIRYDLICDKGHEFDGWFRDSLAFDAQVSHDLVLCALCGSEKVGKQLMAPGIPARSNRREPAAQKMAAGLSDRQTQKMMALMRQMRAQVEANAEYVGENFPEEARRIHYKEAEKRGIYGEASAGDAKALIEEGIEVHPLPPLPEDGN